MKAPSVFSTDRTAPSIFLLAVLKVFPLLQFVFRSCVGSFMRQAYFVVSPSVGAPARLAWILCRFLDICTYIVFTCYDTFCMTCEIILRGITSESNIHTHKAKHVWRVEFLCQTSCFRRIRPHQLSHMNFQKSRNGFNYEGIENVNSTKTKYADTFYRHHTALHQL